MMDDWVRFLGNARSVMGDERWTARELLERLAPKQHCWQVEEALKRNGLDRAARTLGKMLAARRGWRGDLHLGSFGDGSNALRWQLSTLDEVLASGGGVP